MGGRAIACLNARDRNVLGFRRDLLTAAAYGVDEFLFVYGDRPETGGGTTVALRERGPARKDPVAGDGGCTSNRANGTVTRDRRFANSISAFPVTDWLVRTGSCAWGR